MKLIVYGLSNATLFVADVVKKTHEMLGTSDNFAHIDTFEPYKFIVG